MCVCERERDREKKREREREWERERKVKKGTIFLHLTLLYTMCKIHKNSAQPKAFAHVGLNCNVHW